MAFQLGKLTVQSHIPGRNDKILYLCFTLPRRKIHSLLIKPDIMKTIFHSYILQSAERDLDPGNGMEDRVEIGCAFGRLWP